MRTYIFDLDGTIANCDHRQDFALNKDWDTFHSLCHLDKPYKNVIRLFTDLPWENSPQGICQVIIVTGRSEKYRAETEAWLSEHDCNPDALYMRPEDDRRKDSDYKLGLVDSLFGSRENALKEVVCWFEDRDSLVEDLRNAGFTILQTKAGSY